MIQRVIDNTEGLNDTM